VVKVLFSRSSLLEERRNIKFSFGAVADIKKERFTALNLPESIYSDDALSVVRAKDIDIVVELIGGTGVARQVITEALRAGKHVVTANKALLAEYGYELFGLAQRQNVGLFFEASVGGGIPIIRAIKDGMVANEISKIYGILNGTCNYILTKMEQSQISFEMALKEAQKGGYAEADPSLDIDGIDTAHKAVILASLASGCFIPMKKVPIEGIRSFSMSDLQYAKELGYKIKLLAVIENYEKRMNLGVYPALVPIDHILSSVNGVFNAILVDGDGVGEQLFYGKGAGELPTASAVWSDIVEASSYILSHRENKVTILPHPEKEAKIIPADERKAKYYLRLTLLDQPGVFGQIGSILGKYGVSIASLLQKERKSGKKVPVIIITHQSLEAKVRLALEEIAALPIVGDKTVALRIVDFLSE
jgi:homoserine dehydrogenase